VTAQKFPKRQDESNDNSFEWIFIIFPAGRLEYFRD